MQSALHGTQGGRVTGTRVAGRRRSSLIALLRSRQQVSQLPMPAANLPSPQDPRDRGLWLQDRRTFRSGIGRPRLDGSGFTEPLNARLL